MEFIADGVTELFGEEVINAFRRINDYLYAVHYIEITQEQMSFFVALILTVITLGVSILFAVLLFKFFVSFIEWGVNKLWLQ